MSKQIDDIKKYINIQYKTLCIFRLLSLYNLTEDELLCLDSIITLVKNINENAPKAVWDTLICNKLVNDYYTLQDLILEFKDSVYPKFTLTALSFIETKKMEQIDEYYSYKKSLKKKTSKPVLCEYMLEIAKNIKNDVYKNTIIEKLDNICLSEDDLDDIMGIFKTYIKETDDFSFNKEYEYLGFLYFDYLSTDVICF